MKIGIANDHHGVELKNKIIKYLHEKNIECINFGTNDNESVDYVEYAVKLCTAVNEKQVDLGILICGTGIGMSIAANKVKGIRACTCSEPYSAEYSRRHNNANVVTFGARVIGPETAKQIVKVFMETEFEGGRHERRVNQLIDIENEYFK